MSDLKPATDSDAKPRNSCDNCRFHDRGVIHGYTWQTCTKDWRDTPNGPLVGVIRHMCRNHQPKKGK